MALDQAKVALGGWGFQETPGRRIMRRKTIASIFQVAPVVKNPPANAGDIKNAGFSLGQEDPLEEGMATNSSILAWRIPMNQEAWWATVHGVAKSRTRLSD